MKILITGYGKMGRMVEELAQQKGWEILAALDGQDAKLLRQLKKADAAVDFSHPAMLDPIGQLYPPYWYAADQRNHRIQ